MQERLPFYAIPPSKGNGGLMSANQTPRFAMLMLLSLLLISCGVGNIHCSAVPDNSTDRLWLLDFKAVTNDPMKALSSWNSSTPHCQWKGVNCSLGHIGHVTALNLTGQNLQGQIAPSLGNLTFLRILDLSSNGFFGQLPTFNRLHKLNYLDLRNNKLQGFTPDPLINCTNLLHLDLSLNSMTGSLPPDIGSLSNLVYLYLSENNFTGIIPPSLHNITNLMLIDLSSNEFQGSIPEELGRLPSILALSLGANRLSGRIPTTILNHSALKLLDLNSNFLQMELPSNIGDTLPKLWGLSLHHNMFQGQIPASLGNAPLEIIDFTSNGFTGQVPSSLGKLSNLSYLKLETNKLEANDSKSWEFLDALSNCSYLQVLSLYDNQLQGNIPNSVGKLSPGLAYLSLEGNNLSGPVPESIGSLTGLTALSLSQNYLSGPIGGWVGNLTNLRVLSLSENDFAGPIPSSIAGLTQLTKLFLYGNKFEGPIPPSLGNLPFLSVLNLSQNNLNGHIPKELFSSVSALTQCIVSYNDLEGPIPPEISSLKQLTVLQLSTNKLSGEIPVTLAECEELDIFLVDNNFLTGNIPKSMSDLKSLSMLNLSHNNLSGSIPIELSQLSYLNQLDLSYNNLQGEIPREGVFGNAANVSLGGNWRLCGGPADFHMPLCSGAVSQRSETEYYLVRALIPLFGFMSLAMLTYVIITGKKTSRRTNLFFLSFGKKFPRISYKDLNRATGNFSEAKLLGRGSYGSVYRGELTQAKIQVAIKVFDLDMKWADKSFVTECEVLRSIRHRNLVPILTACSTIDNNGDPFKALIYEFMPNGNLDTWLHSKFAGEECLSLAQRLSIAVGIADALAYLHNDCERQIVHCDLKPTNILLDNDMIAYMGDFGIASLVGHSGSNTSVGLKGTIGYIAPEYAQSGQASISGDVYSFGVVLLEMLISKRPTDPMFENELNLVNFVERNYPDQILHIIDAHLQGECEGYSQANITMENAVYVCLLSLMQVALSCTRLIPRERMIIREVTTKLHSIKTSYIRETKHEQVMLHQSGLQ